MLLTALKGSLEREAIQEVCRALEERVSKQDNLWPGKL